MTADTRTTPRTAAATAGKPARQRQTAATGQAARPRVLLLRLAGPLQSWGDSSAFNRRETRPEPTKSALIGLLAAAAGRPREAPLTDLLQLRIGVRSDQPGTLLRDYHTVSDYRHRPLLQAGVNAKGLQKLTSRAKHTHVTQRFYLQDAVFLAAVTGPHDLITALAEAVTQPAWPLALGRRTCVPTQPLSLGLRTGELHDVLTREPWQATSTHRHHYTRQFGRPRHIDLPAALDDPDGDDLAHDLPQSFAPRDRSFTSRRIHRTWLRVPTGFPHPDPAKTASGHDPFALLGW